MKRKDLTTDEKTDIFHELLEGSNEGRPQKGKMKALGLKYGCNPRCISRIWQQSRALKAQGVPVIFKNNKVQAVRPKKWLPDLDYIKTLEPWKRQNITDLALVIEPSRATIGRWMKLGLLKWHTNAMKPDLTAPNKFLRLRFTLKSIHQVGPNNKLIFKNMHNIIHIDEKWFNMKKVSMRVIVVPGEEDPYRGGNKQHIPKVMFICAVGRPIYAICGACLFDGKIGVWPFSELVAAQRNSRNRPAGTPILKPLDSINKVVVKHTLINEVLPAIKAKWPPFASKTIYIQQDNAPPHIRDDDPEFRAAASADGWDIHLIFQPPNSPDMNINDLGWFRSLQTLQHKTIMRNISDLINAVKDSFLSLSDITLGDTFLSLQNCMIEILKVRGGNNYKLPHMKKNTLRREGRLPNNLEVNQDLVRDCMLYLMEQDMESDFEDLTQTLGVTFMLA